MTEDRLSQAIAGHMGDLTRLAGRLTGGPAERDDLVQETVLRALERRDRLVEPQGLRAWLFRIMRNRMIDLYRSDAARTAREDSHAALRPDHTAAMQDTVVRLGQIRAAFGALPPEQRRALELVAIEGLSCAAAARREDIPLGTLLSRLARARAALRAFEDEGTPAKAANQETRR